MTTKTTDVHYTYSIQVMHKCAILFCVMLFYSALEAALEDKTQWILLPPTRL